ncbi:MAG TPA: CBS domain-containing protein [Nitrososphaera sp.]|nr:CBS domain-containing protein [Nitrososphaera sp.]
MVAKRSQDSLKVKDMADRTFISLDQDTLVAEAAKTLYEQEGCSVIVTRNDRNTGHRIPIGIVTERDIIFRVVAQNRGPFKVTLKDIMSSPIVTVHSEKSPKEALAILKHKKINRLPVVDGGGQLVGILTTQMIVQKLPVDKIAEA